MAAGSWVLEQETIPLQDRAIVQAFAGGSCPIWPAACSSSRLSNGSRNEGCRSSTRQRATVLGAAPLVVGEVLCIAAQELILRISLDGCIKQLDEMEGGHRLKPSATKSVHQLEEATGIRGSDSLGARRHEIFDFAAA